MFDALIIGSGPAGFAMAAALGEAGLKVSGLTATSPFTDWSNTYGIWCDELEPLGLSDMLSHRWNDCVVYAGRREIPLRRVYGLFDNVKLRDSLRARCERAGMTWHSGSATQIEHHIDHSRVMIDDGAEVLARIVIDASGHMPVFVQRPPVSNVAFQAAYGIVGEFSTPPVSANRMVLMDYRSDHLTPSERAEPPTFLYTMDLGGGQYLVEETSLAYAPAVSFEALERRLHRRLEFMGIQVREAHHIERCLFPMNLPLPHLDQLVLGFGGAASMVHPASGYLVGAALKRAPIVAEAIAQALGAEISSTSRTARAGWQTIWPNDRVRKRYLYLFGLENLMRFDDQQTNDFFSAFFQAPFSQWSGYLSDTLSIPEVLQTMLSVFGRATNGVRRELMQSVGGGGNLLWRALVG